MDMKEGWRVRHLDDEPIYCDAPCDEADMLCAGFDHEDDKTLEERRRRYEEAATRFLQGHTPRLLSTILRGPFEGPDAKGWVNPWQSRSKNTLAATQPAPTPAVKPTTESEQGNVEELDVEDAASCHLPSPRSLDQVGLSPHPFMETDELERVQAWRSSTESVSETQEYPWSLDASLSQSHSQIQRKRRSTGSEWLKRQDTKRRKAGDTNDTRADPGASQLEDAALNHNMSHLVQEREDAVMGDETASLESSRINPQTPQKAWHSTVTLSHQQQLSQTRNNHAAAIQEGMPAALSTPIQTPQSTRKKGVNIEESAPHSSGVTMVREEAGKNAEGRHEFETQQDESFLFRARRRNQALNTSNLSPLRRRSSGRVSSAASTTSIETDSQGEVQDLEGDACMADDTKATSPESNAEDEGQTSPGKDTVQGVESHGLISEPMSSDTAPDATKKDLDPTETINNEVTEVLESLDQHLPVQTNPTAGATDLISSQEPTLVAFSATQEQQEELPLKEVDLEPLCPPTPVNQSPTQKEPAIQASSSSTGILPNLFSQSPWSKLSQFIIARSPNPLSNADRNHRQPANADVSIAEGSNASQTPATPLMTLATDAAISIERKPDQAAERPSPCTTNTVAGTVNQQNSPALPASQQSPWNMDVPAIALPQQQQQPKESDTDSFIDPSCQSPWTVSPAKMRQAAREALMSRFFNVTEPPSPSPLAPVAVMTPAASSVGNEQSATVDAQESVSPVPIFSIKSFANFLSPSPEKPRRRLNKVRRSTVHLPSTQNLIAATTDNPWDSVQKSVKRVRWALLPNEVEGDKDIEYRDPSTPTTQKAASPPPETAVADLPTGEDDQYKKHFQAVSLRKKLHHHLLPSASQQVLESPGPMAMAEAFVSADSCRPPPAPEATMRVDDIPLVQNNVESQESAMDDVDDVLRHLNEFIEMVDVEADLARAEEEERKKIDKQQQQRVSQALGNGLGDGFSFDAMMDAGVWD
ncbi:protamine P1 [Colletotrichum orchidophilum]|uniref:Protamine P1 n=1 Tax=Colletotrichum orchidophilum TaxID=1209926 RepID=A0A1G4BLM1_9PEZI|nr:protamine P1 [Colletotrichum orchidophilum]OHF02352.1 protamine P1 [Colletotrichum orchidophilum]